MLFDKKSDDERILARLAEAYDDFESAKWSYGLTSTSTGKFLIDRCMMDPHFLNAIASKIGHGLVNKNPDATKASLLLMRMYEKGFDGELYKSDIRDAFKAILPEKSIERLNERPSLMSDCLISIAVVEDTKKSYNTGSGKS